MAGGQRIDDHKSWVGTRGKASVFPDGPHKTKEESTADGAGELMQYEDTTERIKDLQTTGMGKIKGRPLKPTYRN